MLPMGNLNKYLISLQQYNNLYIDKHAIIICPVKLKAENLCCQEVGFMNLFYVDTWIVFVAC